MKITVETSKAFLSWIEAWDNWENKTNEDEPETLSDVDFASYAYIVKHPNRVLKAWIKDYCERFIFNGRLEQDRPRRKELFFENYFACTDCPKERKIITSFWRMVDDYLFRNYKSL